MVLFLFALMLLSLDRREEDKDREWLRLRPWLLPSILTAVLLAELVYVITSGDLGRAAPAGAAPDVDVKRVGTSLFGPYLLGVELASLLLLAGLVAAHRLTREDPEKVSDEASDPPASFGQEGTT